MACKHKRGLLTLAGLFAVAFAVHYALFGSLPLGKPELLRGGGESEWTEVEA